MPGRWLLAGGAALAATATLAAGTATPGTSLPRVDPGARGTPVAPSFLGLSVEYPSLLPYAGTATRPNRAFTALLDTLSRAQGSPVALRIGGNSADRAWWDPTGRPRPASVRTSLGRTWLSSLAALERRTRSPLTLTLDLALRDPANALALARATARSLPRGALGVLELGNEPDLYGRRLPTAQGRLGPSPFPALGRFGPRGYVALAGRYAATLTRGLRPTPALAVGGFAGSAWNVTVPALLRRGADRASVHAYGLYGCSRRARTAATVRALLAGSAARVARRVARAVRTDGLARRRIRVAELNSVSCGGRAGVSDTFASALWGADALFRLAALGVGGADVHTFAGARYAPFAFSRSGARALPLYYGMLLFARATPRGARLVGVTGARTAGLDVFATVARRTVRVVAIDRSPDRGATLTLRASPHAAPATAALLRAPSASARRGVTFAGQSVGADGRLHRRPRVARLPAAQGAYRLRIPAAAAALVTLPAP